MNRNKIWGTGVNRNKIWGTGVNRIDEAAARLLTKKSTGEKIKDLLGDRFGDMIALPVNVFGVIVGLAVIALVVAYPIQWAVNYVEPLLHFPKVTFLQITCLLFLGMFPVRVFYFLRHRSMTNDWTRSDLEYFR